MPSGVQSSLPAQLAQAINSAAATYHVPADLLVGIWHTESGSSYPNPYGNGKGYGGLFGTNNWASGPTVQVGPNLYTTAQETSPQNQANEAAQILSQELENNGGNVSAALLGYSGGGYSSVPGQTSTGILPGYKPGTTPPGGIPGGATILPPGGSEVALGSAAGSAAYTAANTASGGTIGDVKQAAESTASFLGQLTNPNLWIRIAEIVGGVALLGLGLYLFAKDLGIADPMAGKIPGGNKLDKAAEAARALELDVRVQSAENRRQESAIRLNTAQTRGETNVVISQERAKQAKARTSGARADARAKRQGANTAKQRAERAREIQREEIYGLQMGQ